MATFLSVMAACLLFIIGHVSGYEFDVFISYSRHGSAPKWLMAYFLPKLRDRLVDEYGPESEVFLDKDMPRAVDWSAYLRRTLHRSKIMIAVLSAPYFKSGWCMSELRSMYEREKMLGLASVDRPQGLIVPVLYADSNKRPDEEALVRRSWWDFKKLGTVAPAFQESRAWMLFDEQVNKLTDDLVELLEQVPEWQPDWPIIDPPQPLVQPPVRKPRL